MELNNIAWAAKDEIFDLEKDSPGETCKEIRMGDFVEVLDENVMMCRPEFWFAV
jgi:hypothetical protein